MSNSPNPFHSPSKQTPQQGPGAPPPMPPRRANLATLPSNNPFRNNPPPPDVNVVDDDEDEDLRKALAMSRGDITDETAAQGKDGEDEGRRERERSVRASGVPPPSPEGEDLSKGVVFGPTEKNDPEGKMSLVPGTPGPVNNVGRPCCRDLPEHGPASLPTTRRSAGANDRSRRRTKSSTVRSRTRS